MSIVDDFRFFLKDREFVPIIVGGMGVDISNSKLALAIANLGGIGHISDAMSPCVSDRAFRTTFQSSKRKRFAMYADSTDKGEVKWDPRHVYEATVNHVRATMEHKSGPGAVFVNIMEKLTMGNPLDTLRARLRAAMDAGIEGITLSAGLHTGSLKLMEDHPRFRDVFVGIIASSARALKIFLRSAKRAQRLPDYIVVEGPLAGGHLGFDLNWKKYNLKSIVEEIISFLKLEKLDIPVVPAGGIFTGTDAAEYLESGAGAVQVATRFTIAQECGLPDRVKQEYLRASEDDVVVNMVSPTGYAMRMLRYSPSLQSNVKPNCEALGYMLDSQGRCAYIDAYESTGYDEKGQKLPVEDKMCICTHFMRFQCYTCGHYVYRLKDTTVKLPNGDYYLPPAKHIFDDYRYSANHEIKLPELPAEYVYRFQKVS